MKIIVIGGRGLIGQAVVALLQKNHEVIIAARDSGDIAVDIEDSHSIKRMYETVSDIDAIVSCTGRVHFGAHSEITDEEFHIGLKSKLMGQVNLVTIGQHYIKPRGSFTLTSGILNRDPIVLGASAAMVNGAIDAYVKAAAIELPQQQRINVVSPTVITEAMDKYADFFQGYIPIDANACAQYYLKSVAGKQTGQVYNAE